MKFNKIVILFSVVLSLTCCKKYVVDINPEYEGEWHAFPTVGSNGIPVEKYFIIEGREGVFGEWCELVPLGSNCSSYFEGDVKFSLNKKKLRIGPTFNTVIISIDVPPHINSDGDWECTLTERVYIKQ